MNNHTYQDDFYDYINSGSGRSAKIVIPTVVDARPAIESVLDVGCGQGAWLAQWIVAGVSDVVGVDGSYVNTERLLIPTDKFVSHDLAQPINLNRKFDLVQCLEVAEHLDASVADAFVSTLTRHSDVVMFSAAVPGQGGEFHVNEQPLDYWRDKFAMLGYAAFDAVRPHILENSDVEPWYRYNILVFANTDGQRRLSLGALQRRLPDDHHVPQLAPIGWRIRNMVVGTMPRPVVEAMAQAKHSVVRRLKKSK